MSVNWNWVLVIGGALLILIEVAMGGFAGFDLVLIGSSFVIGGGLGLLFHNTVLGLLTASLLCLLYVAIGRRWVHRRVRLDHVRSNVDAILGQRAVVTARVSSHEPGQVRVRDEVWRAVPADDGAGPFESGAIVTIQSVDGVTLQVR